MGSNKLFKEACDKYGQLGRCRSCIHIHREYARCVVQVAKYGSTGDTAPAWYITCGCKDWAPHNNLDYLQWKHEKHLSQKTL